MKATRYTDEQIALALRQVATGTPVQEVIRKMGISEQTFYRCLRRLWQSFGRQDELLEWRFVAGK